MTTASARQTDRPTSVLRPSSALSPARSRLSVDERFSLSMRAANADRRNRPFMLLIVGVVALLGSMLFALASLWSITSATSRVQNERRFIEDLSTRVDRLTALASAGTVATMAFAPQDRFQSTMEQEWRSASLDGTPPTARESSNDRIDPQGQVREKRYRYDNLQSKAIGPLLKWIRRGQDAMPGTELSQILLVRDASGWKMTVEFRRLESTGLQAAAGSAR